MDKTQRTPIMSNITKKSMASQRIKKDIQKNLKKTGFARIEGELHEKKKVELATTSQPTKTPPMPLMQAMCTQEKI